MARNCLGNCCVIGGGGWLGSYIVQQLSQDPDVTKPVRSLDVAPARPNFPAHGAVHQNLDIRSAEQVRLALEGIDTVFLVAAVVDIRLIPDQLCREVNVNGCVNVLAGCRAAGVRRLVYTSTMDVVGLGLNRADESWPYAKKGILAPEGGYNLTKSEAERLALHADEGTSVGPNGLAVVALRLTQVFGIGDELLPKVLAAPVGLGSTSTKQSMVYVENAASAHVQAAKRLVSNPEPIRGHAFFICDFEENFNDLCSEIACVKPAFVRINFWVLMLVALLLEVLAFVAYKCLFHLRLPHVRHGKVTFGFSSAYHTACNHTADGSAAQRCLGYRPMFDRNESLARTSRWYMEQRSRQSSLWQRAFAQ